MVRGFTLVELMITVAVAAILMAIAIPSFKSIMLSNQLTAAANDVVGAISAARVEAIKRNSNAQICGNTDTTNGSDTLGDACKLDPGPEGAVYLMTTTSMASQIQAAITSIKPPLQIKGTFTAIRFGGTGLGHPVASTTPYDGTVAIIYTDKLNHDNCRIVKMAAGSVVSVVNTDASDANASECK